MAQRLEVQNRTRRESRYMVMAMARHGNHHLERRWSDFGTTRGVEAFFASQGYTLAVVIDQCRDRENNVPLLRNLLRSGMGFRGGPGSVMTYTDSEGNEVVRFEGESGIFTEATDAALFEKAADDFERSIAKMSYVEFLSATATATATATASGTASIEAYIFQKTTSTTSATLVTS